MTERPINLLLPVEDLGVRLRESVASGSWIDAALAAAGMLQATDDAVGATSSLLTVATAKARARTDAAGRVVAAALDAAARVRPTPAGLWPAERRAADRWREDLAALTPAVAELALGPPGAAAGTGRPVDRMTERADRVLRGLAALPPGLRAAVARIPSCFRAFDQHPDDVTALVGKVAARWPDRARPVVVVGVRTSGSYLAPFAVAAFRRAGFADVAMVSARPDQRPSPGDARTLRSAARTGALAVVVDDPPTSGRAVARVCDGLLRAGFERTSIVLALALFDDAPVLPAPLRDHLAVTLPWPEWSIHRRLGPDRVRGELAAALAPATVRVRELPFPPSPARMHAKRRYEAEVAHGDGRTRVMTVVAAGTGLGHFGAHDVVVTDALSGHAPPVVYARDGVLCTEWPREPRHRLPTPPDVVDYVAARHDALPVARDRTAELRGCQPVWEVVSNHWARAYGRFWPVARIGFVDRLTRRLLRTDALSVPDGDMSPSSWSVGPDGGRPLKLGCTEGAFSNFDLVCFDDGFDVVGAAVHADDPQYAQALRNAYEKRTGRFVSPERWLGYELVHLWDLERRGALDRWVARTRKSQALRRYLAQVLLSGIESGPEGPVVALDVDGVLETDILGFEAPSPASVLALRALHAHGYRTVVVTGRCLDDVREMADLYGLAGGVAEYGSVLYERRSGRVSPLVPRGAVEVLDRLRSRLAGRPDLRIDARHRYTVRASTGDGHGRWRALEPAGIDVPESLTAIVGESQTDFVATGTDKGTGARALLAELGADRPLLAVGDTAADVPLLGWAAASVVPRHGTAEARAHATRVSPHPYQAGLQEAVAGLLGHGPGGCPRCSPPAMTDDTRVLLALLRLPEGTRLQALLRTIPLLRLLRDRAPVT